MPTLDDVITAFCETAEVIVADGLDHARRDDPHRLAMLDAEFDGGQVRKRIVVDYLVGGQVRIALQVGDGTRAFELFATTVQGPQDPAAAH